MPLCVTPMQMQLVISYILHDRVLVPGADFRARRGRGYVLMSILTSVLGELQRPKGERGARTRVMDTPTRTKVSCLSLTIHVRVYHHYYAYSFAEPDSHTRAGGSWLLESSKL